LPRLQKKQFKFRTEKVNEGEREKEEEPVSVGEADSVGVEKEEWDQQQAPLNPKEEDQLQLLQRGLLILAKAQQELLVLEVAPQQQQERSAFRILFLALQKRIEKRSKKTKNDDFSHLGAAWHRLLFFICINFYRK
jgi:hypothetical protein